MDDKEHKKGLKQLEYYNECKLLLDSGLTQEDFEKSLKQQIAKRDVIASFVSAQTQMLIELPIYKKKCREIEKQQGLPRVEQFIKNLQFILN